MPIKIFEPRSAISRIVDIYSFAPKHLNHAASISDQLERFKLVIAFALSGVYLTTSQYKPFNPILGETLQCQFKDGTKVYCEHTSHHPPVTNFLMEPENNLYKYWGFYEFVGNMSANSLKSGLRGPNNIVFTNDNQHIRFRVPDFKLGGTVMGERTIESDGNIVFEDLTNNWKAVVVFNTYKKSGYWTVTESGQKDEYVGLIYECKPINKVESARKLYSKNGEEIKDLS